MAFFTPYLNFDGQCEEAFRFYADCLDGQITDMVTHDDTPMGGEVPPGWAGRIMNAGLVVEGSLIMGSDSPVGHHTAPAGVYVSMQIAEVDRAERVFGRMSEGGRVIMPMEKTFWAERFGMFVDRFGTHWMINCNPPA